MNLKHLAKRFCAAPLPESVRADLCATLPGPGRFGTNLLTVEEAEAVLGYTLGAMPRAARDVLAERQRQIETEGWTPEHDDQHDHAELSEAASCYAWAADADPDAYPVGRPPSEWPWDPKWWKPCDQRQMLVKAGALILAEIERLDRAAAKTPQA
jgi:hypothetical protein